MSEKYYVGLDMGTTSVGWAVTDSSYNLIRRKGKDMWGVRIFPEAATAAERRAHRTGRRRLQRERARIGMLRELLQPEIEKVDAGFYQRLQDSKFWQEDKTEQQRYALFNDPNFTDKDYYKAYPTIFHLRKELIDSKEPHDIRLIYLAILNIFKHRGHFLNANLGEQGTENIRDIFASLNENYKVYTEEEFADIEVLCQLEGILISREYSATKKCEEIANKCGISKSKDKSRYEMLKLVCGLSGTLSVLFPDENYDEETKKMKISFKAADLEEALAKAEAVIGESAYEILLDLKRVCDWSTLANIMSGDNVRYISDARIQSYEKHKADLKLLKKVYRRHAPEKYDEMFREMKEGNYSAYVGFANSENAKKGDDVKGKPIRRCVDAKNRTEQLMSGLKKAIMAMDQDDDTQYILDELDKNTFLPKQLTADNGIIPYQLHKAELVKILENASAYIPLLLEKDESGLTVSERIIALFEYNIPYFVGPLRNTQNGTGWSKVEGKGKITPWNIEQRIDFKNSEEEFIQRMIRHCTYLSDEYVLPRESLMYQKYCVLNELNNLKVNGEKISVALKQSIYQDLFKKGKKVTGKKLKDYLEKQGIIEKGQEVILSGFDMDFVNTLSSYKKFAEVLAVDSLTYEQEQMAENIIRWITIHSGSKKMIKEKLEESYGDILTKNQIDRIAGYKFTDWGNLSKEFLQTPEKDGETTIIDGLWNTNCNLMELLSSEYGYGEVINEKCNNIAKTLYDIEYEDLEGLYLSSPVKRMVWQTLLILKEITKVMGGEPAKLFVEMTRGNNGEEKQRTQSRQKRLEELYKACKKEEPVLFEKIKGETDAHLRIKKLYLYYTQKGRCMYTGDVIEIEDLMNDNLYDIDHIYPRHFRKDDSLENNLVLVKKHINNRKQDTFPIENDIRKKMSGMWYSLYKGGFISKIKFERLTRNTQFTAEEKAEFISRQLVETSQGTKAVANLMEEVFANSQVIYVKAATVSQFRQQKDMLKVRSVNDLHHANDAYLNIVVGNVYNVKFTRNPLNFIKEYERNPEANKYHLDHMFDYEVRRGEETAWTLKGDTSIAIVKRMMQKKTPLVTYMNYEAHGGITKKDTIYSAEKATGDAYFPISTSDVRLRDVTRYGGRTGVTGTYFFLVEHTEKNKRVRTLEPMYLHMVAQYKTTEDIEKYCREQLGYEEPSVRLAKIKMYSKIAVNGYDLLLTGRSGNQLLVSNAVQLKLDSETENYIKKIGAAIERDYSQEQVQAAEISEASNMQIYDVLTDKHLNGFFKKKPNPIGEKLSAHREDFIKLEIMEQCKIIAEVIKATGKENNGANLKAFEEAVATGKILLNKKISNYARVELINQSVTGLYESRVNLLTV